MTTTLRRVLVAFEEAGTTLRLDDLCRQLDVDPGTLDSMIQHWVRRGKIREVPDTVDAAGCGGCGVQSDCPFVLHMPKRYALAHDGQLDDSAATVCYSTYSLH
jgi:hypothetical protein